MTVRALVEDAVRERERLVRIATDKAADAASDAAADAASDKAAA